MLECIGLLPIPPVVTYITIMSVIAADVFLAGLPPIVVLVPVIGHDQDDHDDDDDVHTPIGDQLQLLPPKTPGAPRKTPFQRDT